MVKVFIDENVIEERLVHRLIGLVASSEMLIMKVRIASKIMARKKHVKDSNRGISKLQFRR